MIQKSDRGNSVVIVNKGIYINKTQSTLFDSVKFENNEYTTWKRLHFENVTW